MSSYEFWDELGKIFNAVVAYQEKNIEFNKRFISPWIRLGNVFEKQDRNKEAVEAYERAIEIDEANPRNWYELGNIHFKMENFPEAISAYNRAIELDAGFGLAYSNLALTLAATGKSEEAISLYQKAIGLLDDAKDKAVAWNRLGNAYRKLNQYERALEAFHRADELDRDNAGFRDSLDEATATPAVMQSGPDGAMESAEEVSVSPIELIVAESRADEAAANAMEAIEAPVPTEPEVENFEVNEVTSDAVEDPEAGAALPVAVAAALEATEPGQAAIAEGVSTEADAEQAQVQPEPAEATAQAAGETVTVVVQDSTETFTITVPVGETATETTDAELSVTAEAPPTTEPEILTQDVITSGGGALSEDDEDAVFELDDTLPIGLPPHAEAEPMAESLQAVAALDPAPNSLADQLLEEEPEVLDVPQHVAYEEYLKDTSEPIGAFEADEPAEAELPVSAEPAAKIDASGDLQIEMDTKNAHVWNELGNVYFNSSAFDDAIVAYSKAIELDRWFAWPYSNLALAYVQKRRFVEAILLYQRSIELFASEKDKAISWNRLGNVYRRLNDYENAIAAYQRADAMDPDNSTLSLQSRFSLLGNYAMEQKPAYVS